MPLHFHPELELVYIVEGSGNRIVGDNISAFQEGDLVFLGSNIPHVWYSKEAYHKEDSNLRSRAIVLYFSKEVFGESFYQLNETNPLKSLYHKAERGMQINDPAKDELVQLMKQTVKAEGLDRIIGLLKVLNWLARCADYELLAGIGYQNTYDTNDNHKIDEVFQYVSKNFRQEISLDEMAKICHLTRQSFCRFFKKRTQKTFIEFLNEFRISHAKKLIADNDDDVTVREVAYDCGFNNISNFNRTFKDITGTTPLQYKSAIRHTRERA